MSVKPIPLNSDDIKEIQVAINHLNSRYYKKKVYPLDTNSLLLSGAALTMGEIPVSHLKVIWQRAMDDPNNSLDTWKDIEKNKNAELIIYVSKFKRLFSSRYYSNVEISFKKDKKSFVAFIGAKAGKRIVDLFYNMNEVLEFRDEIKFCNETESAIKHYT